MKKPSAMRVTPSLTPIFQLTSHKIEDEYNDNDVKVAFWTGDEKLIYAYRSLETHDKVLKWSIYDPVVQFKEEISSPLKYDSKVWGRLGIPIPYEDVDVFPELRGYVSPSGKYVIYSVEYGDVSLGSTDSTARKEFWLADSRSQWKMKLLEGFLLGGISNVQWHKNETKVIFDYGYEGGVRLYVADVQKGTVVSLNDMSDFKRGTEQLWAVSPDGNTLAVSDFSLNLDLVDLETGKATVIDSKARSPQWSKDGKTLYYWWGPEFEDISLRAYNLASGRITNLIDVASLESNRIPAAYFAVAPHGEKIAFWSGDLWLVELLK